MSRQTIISLVGAAALGARLLGMSAAFATPADGAVIAEAASASVTQKAVWRGRAWGSQGASSCRGWDCRAEWNAYGPVYGYGRVYRYGPYGYGIYYGAYHCPSCTLQP
jgi:hypothetical protein